MFGPKSDSDEDDEPIRLTELQKNRRMKLSEASIALKGATQKEDPEILTSSKLGGDSRSRLSALVKREKLVRAKGVGAGTDDDQARERARSPSPSRRVHFDRERELLTQSRFYHSAATASSSSSSSGRSRSPGGAGSSHSSEPNYDHEHAPQQAYDYDLLRRLDSGAFHDISRRMSTLSDKLAECPDESSIKKAFTASQTDLATFGLSQLQLWFLHAEMGTLDSRAGDTQVSISASHVNVLRNLQRQQHGAKALFLSKLGTVESEAAKQQQREVAAGTGISGSVLTIRPDAPMWEELERAMRLVGSDANKSDERLPSAAAAQQLQARTWYAIHVISPRNNVTGDTGDGAGGSWTSGLPFILVAESLSAASSIAITPRMVHSSPAQVKSIFLLECLQKLYSALILRLTQLKAEAHASEYRRTLSLRACEEEVETIRRESLMAMSQLRSAGEIAEALSRTSQALLAAYARAEGSAAKDAGVHAWILLPLNNATGSYLQPRRLGGEEVTYRIYSGSRGGEYVHTRSMAAADTQLGLIGQLFGTHPHSVNVLPSVPVGDFAELGLTVPRRENAYENIAEDATNDWHSDGVVRQFTVISVSVPLRNIQSNGSFAVSFEEDSHLPSQERERCVLVVACPALKVERCSKAVHLIGNIARSAIEALNRRSKDQMRQNLHNLPGTLLLTQRFDHAQALPAQPAASRLIGAVQSFARALKDSDAAQEAFCSHGCSLLMSDTFASTLNLVKNSNQTDEMTSFFAVSSSGLLQSAQPSGEAFERGSMLWLQHLFEGQTVRFIRSASAPLAPSVSAEESISGAAVAKSGDERRGDPTESIMGRRKREALEMLQKLVLGIAPQAQTAFLLPIKASAGLCILLVVDTTVAPADKRTTEIQASTYLDSADILETYQASNICARLASALDVSHAMHTGQLAAFDRSRIEMREEALRRMITARKEKQQRQIAFICWREQTLRRELRSSKHMLEAVTSFINTASEHEDGDAGSGGEETGQHQLDQHEGIYSDESNLSSFMSRVERHVRVLFPDDSVDITLGGLSSPVTADHLLPGQVVLQTELEIAGHARAVFYGVIRDLDQTLIVASVRVVRTLPGSRGPFPSQSEDQLRHLCKLASLVYGSLQKGINSPTAKGNVQGLLLPLMQKLLPLLAAQPALSQTQSGLRTLLEELATAFKYLCGGDVAILRMQYGLLCGNSATFEESAKGVCNVSSEDVSGRSLSSLFRNLPAVAGYVTDESIAFTELASAESSSRPSFAQLALKLTDGQGPGAVTLAEIKVLGPQDGAGFSAEQADAARLLSFVLSHTLSVAARYRELESTGMQAHTIAMQLKDLLEKSSADLEAEKVSSAMLRKRLGAAVGLSMFIAQARDLASVADLAAFVSDALPPILGSTSAVLLLRASAIARTTGASDNAEEEEGLRIVLPARAVGSNETPKFLSFAQLAEVPAYEGTASSGKGQEKLLMYSDGSRVPFAAILILRPSPSARGIEPPSEVIRPWAGLSDVLVSALTSCITGSLDRIAVARTLSSVKDELKHETSIHAQTKADRDRLAVCLQSESALKEEYAAQAANLNNQTFTGKAQLERLEKEKLQQAQLHADETQSLVASRDAQNELYVAQIRSVEKAGRELQREIDTQTTFATQLSTLCDSFAFDPRCHKQSVGQWLSEFVEERGCILLQISQAADGSLSGAHEVHGVISAAAEALRTQNVVQISTTYSPKTQFPGPIGSAEAASVVNEGLDSPSRRQRWLAIRKNGDRASVLCIPNKCISLHATHDNACYVILRGARDQSDRFSETEEALMRCASGLCCRALFRASSKYSFEDVRCMELELQQERATLAKLRHAALAAEGMLRRSCTSPAEFAHEVEVCVSSLLMRGASDPCVVDCMVWYIPAAFSNTTVDLPDVYDALHSNRHSRSDAEAVKNVLSTERSVRIAGTLWAPLKNVEGKLFALLRCERKLASNIADPLSVDLSARATQLADLLLTVEEEEAVCLFCGQAVASYFRIIALTEAMASIKQAGRAMGLLEEGKTAVETQLASAANVRDEYRGTLTAGSDLMAAACAKRVTVEQILEAARRSLVAFTGSLDCYLLMPQVEGVFPTGPIDEPTDAASRSLSASANASANAATSPKSQADVLFCLESDRSRALRVTLDDGDMEKAAMHAFRPLTVGAPPISGQGQDAESRFSNGHASASWVVRRMYGRDTDNHADVATLCATAVPFALLNGQRAVATVVRRGTKGAFSPADKECIAWVVRVMSYCLDMWVGKGSLAVAQSTAEKLGAELKQLRAMERKAMRLEADTHMLQQALLETADEERRHIQLESIAASEGEVLAVPKRSGDSVFAPPVPNTTEESVLTMIRTMNSVFVGANIAVLQASEAGQTIGDMLPPASAGDDTSAPHAEKNSYRYEESEEGKDRNDEPLFDMAVKNAVAARGTVTSASAKVSYWIGRKVAKSANRGNATIGGLSASDAGHLCIVALIAHAEFPTTWLLITDIERNSSLGYPQVSISHVGLRLSVLLRLLEVQSFWRGHLFRVQEDAARLQELARGLMRENSSSRDSHRSAVSTLASTGSQHRNAIWSTLIGCRELFDAATAHARSGLPNPPGPWMHKQLDSLRKTVAEATGWETSLGHLRAMDKQDGSKGLVLTMSDGSGWSFTAEEVKNLGLAPASGLEGILAVGPPPAAEDPRLPYDLDGSVREARATLKQVAKLLAVDAHELYPAAAPLAANDSDDYDDGKDDEDSSGGEEKAQEEALRDRRQRAAAADKRAGKPRIRIIPEFSSLFPSGVLLVPLARAGALLVLRLRRGAATGATVASTAVDASGAMSVAHIVKDGVCQAFSAFQTEYSMHVASIQQANQLKRTSELYSELLHTHDLTTAEVNGLLARLKQKADESEQLRNCRIQNRRYERGLADWAEMTRGVNLASTRLTRGVPGFWTQASKVLMSIISSHITLRGCGLCVPYATYAPHAHKRDGIDARDEKGVEFYARGYDGTDPGDVDDFESDTFQSGDSGNIAARGLTELGSAVESHVLDLLDGKHNDGSRAVYRLSRPGESRMPGGAEEQVWLVPVRTPHNVLAVVRLTVLVGGETRDDLEDRRGTMASASASAFQQQQEQPSTPAPASPSPQTPGRTKIRFTPDTRMTPTRSDVVTPRTAGSVASLRSVGSADSAASASSSITTILNAPTEAVDVAQTDVLNFAEVMAPLLSAALALSDARQEEASLQIITKSAQAAYKALTVEMLARVEGATMSGNLLSQLSKFAASVEFVGDASVRDADAARAVVTARVIPLQSMMEVAGALMGVSISYIVFNSAENLTIGLSEYDTAFAASGSAGASGALLVEPVPGPAGAPIGKLNISLGLEGRSVLSFSKDAASAGSQLPEEDQKKIHVAVVKSVLPDLLKTVGALACVFARERQALREMVALRAEVGRSEKEMHKSILELQETKQASLSKEALSRHNNSVAQLTRQAIEYVGSLSIGNDGLPQAMVSAGDGIQESAAPEVSLSHTLPLICGRIPGMLGIACEAKIGAYIEKISPDLGQQQQTQSGTGRIHWFESAHANPSSSSSSTSTLSVGPMSGMRSARDKSIAENLAKACISRRSPSAVDVGGNLGAGGSAASAGIKVLSYPLLVPSNDGAVGVLQIVTRMDAATSGAGSGLDMAHIDEFCEMAAASVACIVFSDQRAAALNARINLLETDIGTSIVRTGELEHFMQMWQRRSDAWAGVATAAAVIARHSVSASVGLADVIGSEAVMGPLRGTGVVVRLHRGARSREFFESEHSAGSGSGSGSGKGRSVGEVVRLGDSPDDPIVEISCGGSGSDPSPSGGEQGRSGAAQTDLSSSIAPIATELVDSLSCILRSTSLAVRSRAMEVEELKRAKSSVEGTLLDTHCKLEASLENIRAAEAHVLAAEDLASVTTASMTAFCGPTIREIAVMLEELSTTQGRRPQLLPGMNYVKADQMDWAWEGLARVADRAMSRISEGSFSAHVSILVRTDQKPAHSVQLASDIHVVLYDMSRRKEIVTIASNSRTPKNAKMGVLSDPTSSTVERALLAGGIHENKHSMAHSDLAGIEKGAMTSIMDTASSASHVTVLCIALPDPPPGCSAVLRVVYPSETGPHISPSSSSSGGAIDSGAQESMYKAPATGPRSLIRPVFEMVMALGCSVLHICAHLSKQDTKMATLDSELKLSLKEREVSEEQLNLALKVHRVCVREASSLLDPPLVGPGGSAPRAVHPASLSPLAASQDACMKLLAMTRNLMQCEGQALLLRDNTTDETAFQVIYSGNGLAYPGIEMGSFGTVYSKAKEGGGAGGGGITSLAQVAMQSHKVITVDDAYEDPRYSPSLDGQVAPCVPMVLVPIRGRGSAVIGVLIAVRGRNGAAFTPEDIVASEIAASHGGLSLYWCQGLGALHHVLNKNVSRLQELERTMLQLRR